LDVASQKARSAQSPEDRIAQYCRNRRRRADARRGRHLRYGYRDSIITLLVGPSSYQTALLIDGAEDVVWLKVFNPYASLRELRQHRVDILIDFGPWSRLNSLYMIFSGAAFSVGFRTARECALHGSEVHELKIIGGWSGQSALRRRIYLRCAR
jgi:hypothetical protein